MIIPKNDKHLDQIIDYWHDLLCEHLDRNHYSEHVVLIAFIYDCWYELWCERNPF